MSETAPAKPLAGLSPPPEKWPTLLQQFDNSGNDFETIPRVVFEQPIFRA